jgi:alanyl-tRNA synthetase
MLEKELVSLKAMAAAGATADLAGNARDVGGIKVVAARVEGLDAKALRDSVDQLKSRLGDAVILLASASAGDERRLAGVQGRALEKVKAGELVGFVASRIGGKGGGRADMAQGGGDDSPALLAALGEVPDWVAAHTLAG